MDHTGCTGDRIYFWKRNKKDFNVLTIRKNGDQYDFFQNGIKSRDNVKYTLLKGKNISIAPNHNATIIIDYLKVFQL